MHIFTKDMNIISDSYHVSTIFIFIQKKISPIHFCMYITVYQTLGTVHRKLSIRPNGYRLALRPHL